MFRNNHTFFNAKMSTEEAKQLMEDFASALEEQNHAKAVSCYNQICKNMKLRVEGNYIKPMKQFLKATQREPNREDFGFIVMGINCILTELYFELINGYDESNENGNKVGDAYQAILPQLDPGITRAAAQKFYKGIRCGIIHQGQTKENTAITYEYNCIIERNGDYYLCNPEVLFHALEELYKKYWKQVSEISYTAEMAQRLAAKFKKILLHDTVI